MVYWSVWVQYRLANPCTMDTRWEKTLTSLLAKGHQPPKDPQPPNSSEVHKTSTLNSFDAEIVICLLKMKVNEFAAVEGSNSVYHAFKPKEKTPNLYNPNFYRNTHCEIYFTTFSMDPDAAVKASDKNTIRLKEIAKVCFSLNYRNVSV